MIAHHLKINYKLAGRTYKVSEWFTSPMDIDGAKYQELLKRIEEQLSNIHSKPVAVADWHGPKPWATDSVKVNIAKFVADVACTYDLSYKNNGPRVRIDGDTDKRYKQWPEVHVASTHYVYKDGTYVIETPNGRG